jgi:hypothetical protein
MTYVIFKPSQKQFLPKNNHSRTMGASRRMLKLSRQAVLSEQLLRHAKEGFVKGEVVV